MEVLFVLQVLWESDTREARANRAASQAGDRRKHKTRMTPAGEPGVGAEPRFNFINFDFLKQILKRACLMAEGFSPSLL